MQTTGLIGWVFSMPWNASRELKVGPSQPPFSRSRLIVDFRILYTSFGCLIVLFDLWLPFFLWHFGRTWLCYILSIVSLFWILFFFLFDCMILYFVCVWMTLFWHVDWLTLTIIYILYTFSLSWNLRRRAGRRGGVGEETQNHGTSTLYSSCRECRFQTEKWQRRNT